MEWLNTQGTADIWKSWNSQGRKKKNKIDPEVEKKNITQEQV